MHCRAAGLSKLFLNTEGDITLYVGLPPVELSTKSKSEKQFKEEFIGNYVIKFRANVNKVVNFRIIDVVCIEESFLTLASFFFKPQGGFRPEAKPYIKGNVLGIDIGASTTDLAVMKDCRFVEKTGQTYKVGGNYVLDMIADGIRAEFGYDPEKDELQKAVETGVIDQGSDVIDISSLVEEAKKEFAIKLVDMMQGYFTKIAMQPHTFKVVVVGGGGSMKSSYVSENGVEVETSHPMSEYIWNEFKMICPSVPVVQVSTDPRHANIIGLYIRAIVDKISNQKVVPAVPELQQTNPVNEGTAELRVNF